MVSSVRFIFYSFIYWAAIYWSASTMFAIPNDVTIAQNTWDFFWDYLQNICQIFWKCVDIFFFLTEGGFDLENN